MELDLSSRYILLVEDEYLVARSPVRLLDAWSTNIVGPAGSIASALDLIGNVEKIDFALIDVNRQGSLAYPVSDAFNQRQIPYAITTGYDTAALSEGYRHVPQLTKPYASEELEKVLLLIA